MDIKEIQDIFSEMGLGTSEERDKLVKELSINKVDNSHIDSEVITTSKNTLNTEQYA